MTAPRFTSHTRPEVSTSDALAEHYRRPIPRTLQHPETGESLFQVLTSYLGRPIYMGATCRRFGSEPFVLEGPLVQECSWEHCGRMTPPRTYRVDIVAERLMGRGSLPSHCSDRCAELRRAAELLEAEGLVVLAREDLADLRHEVETSEHFLAVETERANAAEAALAAAPLALPEAPRALEPAAVLTVLDNLED